MPAGMSAPALIERTDEESGADIVTTEGAAERLYVGICEDTGQKVLDLVLHSHSKASDGAYSQDKIADFAKRHCKNIAISDHNSVGSVHGTLPPGIIAATEICTHAQKGGTPFEMLIIGPQEGVLEMYQRQIESQLDPYDPIFRPTNTEARGILEGLKDHKCHVLHPHYTTIEGLSVVDPKLQADIIDYAHDRSLMESNAHRPFAERGAARRAAMGAGIPLITAPDAHIFEDVYTSTFMRVPLQEIAKQLGSIVERCLHALRKTPDKCKSFLKEPGLIQKLRIGAHIGLKLGPRVVSRYVLKALGRKVGTHWNTAPEHVPWKKRGKIGELIHRINS